MKLRLLLGAWLLWAAPLQAQVSLDPSELANPGLGATPAELEAWAAAEAGRHVRARELAQKILDKNRDSFVAHLVIGYVNHYAEADFPRALYHLELALARFEKRFGTTPDLDGPWRWHATLLRELSSAHGALEHYSERLAFMARFNALYEPDMVADRAWPLMKLGRYDEARKAAQLGLAMAERPVQQAIAQNALCAIEFEAGNDGASYVACKRAIDQARELGMEVSAVDLTNFAESSRSLFKLDEAERIGLDATRLRPSWYGNPWMELAELYTRQGRFAEAVGALKRIPKYRTQRPAHVRDADRNETRRAIAALLLVVSRPDEALAVTERALVLPDRRAHNSRDPAQDSTVIALLDRRAQRMASEMLLEDAAAEPFYVRPWTWLQAAYLRVRAWSSGALVARVLGDQTRLVGIFRIGTAASAILPPWLAGELIDVLGPGVAHEAIERARARDKRAGAGAYYDAFVAEVALAQGDAARAVQVAERALTGLGPGEVLLRARTLAIAAQAEWEVGRVASALRRYQEAFTSDPGVFRRLGMRVPVRVQVAQIEVAQQVASMLGSSPRLASSDVGFTLRVEGDGASGSACLVGADGSALGCGRAGAESGDDARALAAKVVTDFHARVFAPRVDLTQADVSSLDGSNVIRDDALKTLFDAPEP
jgi:tetratricopeptide (TPR) repeat protein